MDVGFLKTILFNEIPPLALERKDNQRCKSFFALFVILADLFLLTVYSNLLSRFMKCLASGMMKAAWLSLPIS